MPNKIKTPPSIGNPGGGGGVGSGSWGLAQVSCPINNKDKMVQFLGENNFIIVKLTKISIKQYIF